MQAARSCCNTSCLTIHLHPFSVFYSETLLKPDLVSIVVAFCCARHPSLNYFLAAAAPIPVCSQTLKLTPPITSIVRLPSDWLSFSYCLFEYLPLAIKHRAATALLILRRIVRFTLFRLIKIILRTSPHSMFKTPGLSWIFSLSSSRKRYLLEL